MGAEDPAMQEWVERVVAARTRFLELRPEEQRHGAQLFYRYRTLVDACKVLSGEATFSERRRAEKLEDLEDLREEASVEFSRFEAEMEIPSLEPR